MTNHSTTYHKASIKRQHYHACYPCMLIPSALCTATMDRPLALALHNIYAEWVRWDTGEDEWDTRDSRLSKWANADARAFREYLQCLFPKWAIAQRMRKWLCLAHLGSIGKKHQVEVISENCEVPAYNHRTKVRSVENTVGIQNWRANELYPQSAPVGSWRGSQGNWTYVTPIMKRWEAKKKKKKRAYIDGSDLSWESLQFDQVKV